MSGDPDLPRPSAPFGGRLDRRYEDAEPHRLSRSGAPEGAPNVLVILLDDVGFGTCSTFGGPVPMPALDRIAQRGLRYNQFHTTALCSPTRAALLTGRNHHAVHMGGIPEIANSLPRLRQRDPAGSGTVAQVLRMHGLRDRAVSASGTSPRPGSMGPAGPFDRWPTGMGFDRFYGIIGAEASQWEPPRL